MKFLPLFHSKILKSMIIWFVILIRVWASDKRVKFFSQASKLANSSDIPGAVKLCKLVRRSGKFFAIRGPVLASCKTPPTRKALSCLYFRKTKSEEHIVSEGLFTIRRDNVDISKICGGRERQSWKTAHVGRITKIVHGIRIAFGLPYNYKPVLSLKMI